MRHTFLSQAPICRLPAPSLLSSLSASSPFIPPFVRICRRFPRRRRRSRGGTDHHPPAGTIFRLGTTGDISLALVAMVLFRPGGATGSTSMIPPHSSATPLTMSATSRDVSHNVGDQGGAPPMCVPLWRREAENEMDARIDKKLHVN